MDRELELFFVAISRFYKVGLIMETGKFLSCNC